MSNLEKLHIHICQNYNLENNKNNDNNMAF